MGLRERMLIAAKKPSELRRLDAEELVHRILPRCQVRPYVYNQVAMLAKEVQNEADALALAEAKEAGAPFAPLHRSPFVMHLPADVSKYTMEDRRIDVALLTDILAIPRRSYVASTLGKGRDVLENDLKQMEREYKQLLLEKKKAAARAARMSTQGTTIMLKTLNTILPTLEDRPNLYNQVCAHISMSNEEDKVSPEFSPDKMEADRGMSSVERWRDVERLDEIIDFLEEGTLAKSAFEAMKITAVAEAKATQRFEAERMAKKGFHPLDRLDDIPLSFY